MHLHYVTQLFWDQLFGPPKTQNGVTVCTLSHYYYFFSFCESFSPLQHHLSVPQLLISNFSHFPPPSLLTFPCWSPHLHTRFCSRPAALNTCHTNTPTADATRPSRLENNVQREPNRKRNLEKLMESSFKGTRRTKKEKLYCKCKWNKRIRVYGEYVVNMWVTGVYCTITRWVRLFMHTLHIPAFSPLMMMNYRTEIKYKSLRQ